MESPKTQNFVIGSIIGFYQVLIKYLNQYESKFLTYSIPELVSYSGSIIEFLGFIMDE
jgi:hypothetical protein